MRWWLWVYVVRRGWREGFWCGWEQSGVFIMQIVAKCSSLPAMDGHNEICCCSKGSFAILRGVDDGGWHCMSVSGRLLSSQTLTQGIHSSTPYLRQNGKSAKNRSTCLASTVLPLFTRRNLESKTASTHLLATHGSLDQILWLQICVRQHL